MKKLLLVSVVASVLLFGADEPYYDEPYYDEPQEETQEDSAQTSEGTTTIVNQTVINNIVSDQKKTSTANQRTKKRYSLGADYVYNKDIQVFNIPLSAYVGAGFGISANVPFVMVSKDISSTGNSESGIGDISVGIDYFYGTTSSTNGLSIFSLSYKTTTGDEDKFLGSGADAYSISYKFAKQIDKFTIHAFANYTINSDYTDKDGTNTDYGDSYMLMAGASMPCLISDKAVTSAKITYFNSDDTTYEDSWSSNSSNGVETADLWIQWDSTVSKFPVGLGVKIPLLNKVNIYNTTTSSTETENADKRFSFYLSIAGLF